MDVGSLDLLDGCPGYSFCRLGFTGCCGQGKQNKVVDGFVTKAINNMKERGPPMPSFDSRRDKTICVGRYGVHACRSLRNFAVRGHEAIVIIAYYHS
jgi:hypothetical protein